MCVCVGGGGGGGVREAKQLALHKYDNIRKEKPTEKHCPIIFAASCREYVSFHCHMSPYCTSNADSE